MRLVLNLLISYTITRIVPLVSSQTLRNNRLLSGCGIANSNGGRVIGGYDVGYYKYSWFAALEYHKNNQMICAGSLITPFHVVSAAHCFTVFEKEDPASIYRIILGTENICKIETRRQRFNTKRVIVHEMYAKHKPYYDISLITLDKKATDFTPICLPNYVPLDVSIPYPNEAWVIGYGIDKYNSTHSACELQEARLLIYSNNQCLKVLYDHDESADAIKGVVCAGYLSGGIDSCQGDSGGPLHILGPNNQYILQGVVSFGYGCAEKDTLGVYTDVSKYVDWIGNNLESPQELDSENQASLNNLYYFFIDLVNNQKKSLQKVLTYV